MHVLAYVYGLSYYGGVLSLTFCSQGALLFAVALATRSTTLASRGPVASLQAGWALLREQDFWKTLMLQMVLRCRGSLVTAAVVCFHRLSFPFSVSFMLFLSCID
jgi:hypothetical protein